jgi:hypothetical protein
MRGFLTADDVLSDIEFELVQGAISRDELGSGIQAVKQYQSKVRGEVLQSARQIDGGREMVSRLFQINDMLITLLQEVAAALRSVRLDLRRVARMSQVASRPATTASMPVMEDGDVLVMPDVPAPGGFEEGAYWQSPTEVEEAMRSDALQVKMDVRSVGVPIVGGVVRRLRATLHSLVLFYVGRLARKQVAINQAYGDWILRLVQMNRHQQEQIDVLSAQVAALQARLARSKEAQPPSSDSGL